MRVCVVPHYIVWFIVLHFVVYALFYLIIVLLEFARFYKTPKITDVIVWDLVIALSKAAAAAAAAAAVTKTD